MIIGLLLRHFKCYENIKFIEITRDIRYPYSVYVGDNGVGKSAIFEALDVFFNGEFWNIYKGAIKKDAYIVPMFLLKKDDPKIKKIENVNVIEIISTYFYNIEEDEKNKKGTKELSNFFNYRDVIKDKFEEDYYFLPIGISYDNQKEVFFGSTFDEDIFKLIEENDITVTKVNQLKREVLDMYSYVYLPVEQEINSTLKVENIEMQALLDKNMSKEIDEILETKINLEGGNNQKIITYINNQLAKMIDDINKNLGKLDEGYKYVPQGNKKNLTSTDIRDKIIEAYFSIKELRKNDKPISNLSSGEKRRAMIDTILAFLSNNKSHKRDKNVILAIDEPESSLHISKCFEQFIELEKISLIYGHQILLTTHWYGFVPVSNYGYMHNISIEENGNREIKSFKLENSIEESRKYPDIVELKSIFDLATSILSYMRSSKNQNWIICEGLTDKDYLEHILESKVKIVPVGGITNVKKLFYHIYIPLSEKSNVEEFSNKILFLVDTDLQRLHFESPYKFAKTQKIDKLIFLKRLQNIDGKIELVDVFRENGNYIPTEIEDCLDPKTYYQSVMESLPEYEDKFIFNEKVSSSKIKEDNSILLPKDKNYIEHKMDIIDELNNKNVKINVSEKYIEKIKNNSTNHILSDLILEILN